MDEMQERNPTVIMVVDGYTLNPGDLSWDELARWGSLVICDRMEPERVVESCRRSTLVLTNKVPFSRETIEQLPGLRYIGVTATGYNIVDVVAAREREIVVTNVPSYGTRSVAQMVFAHLLNLTQRVAHHAETVRQGRWGRCPDFCYWDFPLIELEGLTMGLVGLGRIGWAVAELAGAFGMRVLAHDSDPAVAARASGGVEFVELDDLFRRSDVVSLHCPLAEQTERLVDARRLGLMKPTAFLINTARGPLVDAAALAEALNEGRIAGAGLDVLAEEPPPDADPLRAAKNCFITPHIAWATRSARQRLLKVAVENVAAFLSRQPQNVVS